MAIESANPNHFEAGVLLVDLIDPVTFKLLKRNYAARTILPEATPEQQQKRMDEAVAEILNNLVIQP